MPYLTSTDLETVVPGPVLADALDDDRDGSADAGLVEAVIATASHAVDAFLAGLYPVPFADPAPAAVREAALAFAGELIHARRGGSEAANPFAARARFWRTRLEQIGRGWLPLDAASPGAFVPGAALTEELRTQGTTL